MISVKHWEVKNLQTDLQIIIWRRGRDEKIWWRESGERRFCDVNFSVRLQRRNRFFFFFVSEVAFLRCDRLRYSVGSSGLVWTFYSSGFVTGLMGWLTYLSVYHWNFHRLFNFCFLYQFVLAVLYRIIISKTGHTKILDWEVTTSSIQLYIKISSILYSSDISMF